MGGKKSVFTYFVILTSCLTTCLFLFSLENKKTIFKNPEIKNNDPLYPNIKLFNMSFKYLINNVVCEKGDVDIKAVIIVTSYYGNVETRSAMRRAFSNEDLMVLKMRRIFLIAVRPSEDTAAVNYKTILNENDRFGDLIQGNFIEAYRNLTYKHIMGLEWASMFCKNAKYIIKMDDDIVLNIYKLYKLLNTLKLSEKNPLAGYVFRGMVPLREPTNKWFVTEEEYAESTYPPFLSGWFYITTPKLAKSFSELSKVTPYFWIDDVYVTGILARILKIKHLDLKTIFAVHPEYLQCCMQDLKMYNYDCNVIVGPNGGDNDLFFTYNKVMSKCYEEICKSRPLYKDLNKTCIAEKNIHIGHGKAVIETVHLF